MKKILDKEILSDEELENVAGGTHSQTMEVANFLADLGLMKPISGDVSVTEVNAVLKHFHFRLIEKEDNNNLVTYQGIRGKFGRSNLDAMYKSISKAVSNPNFDFTKFN